MPAQGSVSFVGGDSNSDADCPLPWGKLIELETVLLPVRTMAVRVALIAAPEAMVSDPFSITMIVSFAGEGLR